MRSVQEAAKLLMDNFKQLKRDHGGTLEGTCVDRDTVRLIFGTRIFPPDKIIRKLDWHLRDSYGFYFIDSDDDTFFLINHAFFKRNVTRTIPQEVIDRYSMPRMKDIVECEV